MPNSKVELRTPCTVGWFNILLNFFIYYIDFLSLNAGITQWLSIYFFNRLTQQQQYQPWSLSVEITVLERISFGRRGQRVDV